MFTIRGPLVRMGRGDFTVHVNALQFFMLIFAFVSFSFRILLLLF
jgi:hypothetical protein